MTARKRESTTLDRMVQLVTEAAALGALIATTPALFEGLERMIVDGWISAPRGTKRRALGIIGRIRATMAQAKQPDVRVVAQEDADTVTGLS